MKKRIGFIFAFLLLIVFGGTNRVYASDSGSYHFKSDYQYHMANARNISWKLDDKKCLHIETDSGFFAALNSYKKYNKETNELEYSEGYASYDEIIGVDTIKKAKKISFSGMTGMYFYEEEFGMYYEGEKSVFDNYYPNIEEIEFKAQTESIYGPSSTMKCFPNVKKISVIGCTVTPEIISRLKDIEELYIDSNYNDEVKKLINNFKGITISYKYNDTWSGKVKSSYNSGNLFKKDGAKSLEDTDINLKKCIYTYDGSAKTPTVKVVSDGKILKRNEDYTLEYQNNYDDGIATVYVVGQNDYCDVVALNFVILPYNSGMDSVYDDGTIISKNFVYGITDDEKLEVELCCPARKKIKKAEIPSTIVYDGKTYKVTSIGKNAFYKNTSIKELIIGNNVKSIENYAFYGCKNLKDVKIGKNLEIVGNSAFRKCTKLETITLPKKLDELGKNVFYGCTKLKSITLNSNSVVDVSSNAIKNISKKAVIKVPKKLVKKYKKELNKKTGFKKSMKIKKK